MKADITWWTPKNKSCNINNTWCSGNRTVLHAKFQSHQRRSQC